MKEHQEKTIAILPHELILKIFSDNRLGTTEILMISLVCNLWRDLSTNNLIWEALFLRQFSWSPKLFYTSSSMKEAYKQQLSLNFNFEEKCKPDHQCSKDPALLEAVRNNNLPLIEALLHSGHGFYVNFSQTIDKVFDDCVQVVSESTNLPPGLLKKVFNNGVVNEYMQPYRINLFHILCLKGEPILLESIFTLFDDDLLETSYFFDRDGTHFLGDDALRFLRHENSSGSNFLCFLLRKNLFSSIPLLEEVMGQDFIHLLVKEQSNENILKKLFGRNVIEVKDMIIEVLKLMKNHGCLNIIQELYESPEFPCIIENNRFIDSSEISDIFNEYIEKENSGCTLF